MTIVETHRHFFTEVLDPEQTTHFKINIWMFPNLSKVLFVATANQASQIPAPLRDRGIDRSVRLHLKRETSDRPAIHHTRTNPRAWIG